MAGWVTPEQVRDRWSDAAMLSDELLQDMIDAAHVQCVEYAPTLADTDPVPANYVEAEAQQVRSIYTNSNRDGDVLGFGDGFAVRVRPMDENVKALLRPRNPRPRVR